ncbi:glycosyltransferase [Nocardioides pacificus]
MLQLIIPAFNEEHRLPRTLRDLRHYVVGRSRLPGRIEVIVVDNASTDATAEVARQADSLALPVRVLSCPIPGKGAAVRAGVAATEAELVGFMDADGATSLEALDEAWRLLAVGADVAIGSRAVAGSVTQARHSWLREQGAVAYRRVASQIVPGVNDTQCGFKLMHGELARSVFAELRTTGFSFDVEMLARARAHGASITEFPVVWTDVPGSTFEPARDGAGSFRDLALIAWRLRSVRAGSRVASLVPAVAVPAAAAEG